MMKLIEKKTIQRRFTVQDICNWMKEVGYHVPGFTRFYIDDCDYHERFDLSPHDTLVLEFDTEDEVQEAVPAKPSYPVRGGFIPDYESF